MNSESTEERAIAAFFLGLFKSQLGFHLDDAIQADFEPLPAKAGRKARIYELRILDPVRRSRRMSIEPLGENSGARSRCFQVMYDDALVVKIPPEPVTDFDAYLARIQVERAVADRLASEIPCIAPSLSAVLKRIPALSPDDPNLPEHEREAHFITLLRKSPWLQDHLMIQGAFVFVMNLSRHEFLSRFIDRVHNTAVLLHEEIYSHFDILWNPIAFEEVYGANQGGLFYELNELYSEYEKEIGAFLRAHGMNVPTYRYKQKEWFLLFLSGKGVDADEKPDIPPRLLETIDLRVQALFRKFHKPIRTYLEITRNQVVEKSFHQNRASIRGAIANLLELLARLSGKKVACRDLKPDNIFVTDSRMTPEADPFILGLIDFETAAIDQGDQHPVQPLPGGTPAYATPSHLADNAALADLGDPTRLFRLQDWHAVSAIIFQIVTGDLLFEKSRRWLPEFWKAAQKADDGLRPQARFALYSRRFWTGAGAEFQERMSAHASRLKAVAIPISESVRLLLVKEIRLAQAAILRDIERLVHTQLLFRTPRGRSDLIAASATTIDRCRKNWETGVSVPETPPTIRDRVVGLLSDIASLKTAHEGWEGVIARLAGEDVIFSADELLTLFFDLIRRAMANPAMESIPDRSPLFPEDRARGSEPAIPEETLICDVIGNGDDEGETRTYEPTLIMDYHDTPPEP